MNKQAITTLLKEHHFYLRDQNAEGWQLWANTENSAHIDVVVEVFPDKIMYNCTGEKIVPRAVTSHSVANLHSVDDLRYVLEKGVDKWVEDVSLEEDMSDEDELPAPNNLTILEGILRSEIEEINSAIRSSKNTLHKLRDARHGLGKLLDAIVNSDCQVELEDVLTIFNKETKS